MDTKPPVKLIVFDVDGTLYEPVNELSAELFRYWVEQISYALRIDNAQAEARLTEFKSRYAGTTMALTALGLGEPYDVIKQAERHMRGYYKKYLKKDRKLIKILKKLKHTYTLTTLRNGTKAGTRYILFLLGFSPRSDKVKRGYGPFDWIFPTVELGPTKPDLLPFQNILRELGISPEEILVIGDRIAVDLTPAKKLGMKTALVTWGKEVEAHEDVDAILETIYDVKELIEK